MRKRGYGESLADGLVRTYRHGAVKRELPFTLTNNQFLTLTQQDCFYCGAAPSNVLQQKGSYGRFVYNGIDRMDNGEGYVEENCVPCCKTCNMAKKAMDANQFAEWVDRVSRHMPTDKINLGNRPVGALFVSKVTDSFGKDIPLEKAVKYGWLDKGPIVTMDGVQGLSLGPNLFLDQGRQLLAFCFGFRSPVSDYTCQRFGVGTGVTAPAVTDVALESPITLASVSNTTAPILGVDFLTPFVVRVSYQIAIGDANGYLITERGLYSGNGTLFARHVSSAGISKTSDFSPTLTWRIRF